MPPRGIGSSSVQSWQAVEQPRPGVDEKTLPVEAHVTLEGLRCRDSMKLTKYDPYGVLHQDESRTVIILELHVEPGITSSPPAPNPKPTVSGLVGCQGHALQRRSRQHEGQANFPAPAWKVRSRHGSWPKLLFPKRGKLCRDPYSTSIQIIIEAPAFS